MNIFVDFYDQILLFFFICFLFFSRMGIVIFQEMAGVRGRRRIHFF